MLNASKDKFNTTMRQIYVIDTNAVIYYFDQVFGGRSRLSAKATKIIRSVLCGKEELIRISIPSIVFVEIWRKWLRSEEFARRFYYEVYCACVESPNVEIRTIDRETIENLQLIRGSLSSHEIHDKLILASAMTLACPLISLDDKLAAFVQETGVIPEVIR